MKRVEMTAKSQKSTPSSTLGALKRQISKNLLIRIFLPNGVADHLLTLLSRQKQKIRNKLVKWLPAFSLGNNIKLKFQKALMQNTNTSSFLGLPSSQNSLYNQNLPVFVYFFPSGSSSNNHYHQQSQINIDTLQTNVIIGGENCFEADCNDHTNQRDLSKTEKKISYNNSQQTKAQKNSIKSQTKHDKHKPRKFQSSDDDYCPKESSSSEVRKYPLSETKNIPKNYQKAIIQFIGKNLPFTYRVLEHCGVDVELFMSSYKGFAEHQGSMAKLRSLWIDAENPFARVFRIISKEYLRKHCLGYIFNSRVINIRKHIKYRHIIEKSIAKPESLTHMKQY